MPAPSAPRLCPAINLILVLALPLLLAGCKTTPQSTRLRADDFNDTVQAMANSLAQSQFLADRDSQSPPIIIVINKVQNLTTDVITPSEQWMLMARVRASMPIQQLSQQKNLRFQIPPEQYPLLKSAGYTGDLGTAQTPTHVMTAIFRASPRSVRGAKSGYVERRQDYYYLEYALEALAGRTVEWSDSFEVKREASGLAID